MTYQVTVYDTFGSDVVTFNDPAAAIEAIQNARNTDGLDVAFTGDPFGDFAKMNEEDM